MKINVCQIFCIRQLGGINHGYIKIISTQKINKKCKLEVYVKLFYQPFDTCSSQFLKRVARREQLYITNDPIFKSLLSVQSVDRHTVCLGDLDSSSNFKDAKVRSAIRLLQNPCSEKRNRRLIVGNILRYSFYQLDIVIYGQVYLHINIQIISTHRHTDPIYTLPYRLYLD